VSSPPPTDDIALIPRPTYTSGDLPATQGLTRRRTNGNQSLSDPGGPRIESSSNTNEVNSQQHHQNQYPSSTSSSLLDLQQTDTLEMCSSRVRGRIPSEDFDNVLDGITSDDINLEDLEIISSANCNDVSSLVRTSTPIKLAVLPLVPSKTDKKGDNYSPVTSTHEWPINVMNGFSSEGANLMIQLPSCEILKESQDKTF